MNFSFFTSSLFWGVIILLLGISIIFKAIFKVDFPFVRIFFGLLLIYLGIRFFIKTDFQSPKDNIVVFEEKKVDVSNAYSDYNTVFGKSKFNLSNPSDYLEFNTVFGHSTLVIPSNLPYKITANTVFAENELPEGDKSFFIGERVYTSLTYDESKPHLNLEVNTVFGKFEVIKGGETKANDW